MNLDGYTTVPARLKMALDAHPNLRVVEGPVEVVNVADLTFVAVTMTIYRDPTDPLPARAMAWEPFPGRTPYTRGSEMMNASTSALGRALGLMGYGTATSMATAEEVQARREEPPKAQLGAKARRTPPSDSPAVDGDEPTAQQLTKLNALVSELGIGTRQEKLDYVSDLAGRPLDSSKDLTKVEASRIIDILAERCAQRLRDEEAAAEHQRGLDELARLAALVPEVDR